MQHNEPPAVERSLAMYRRLLKAYPPAFREQYGDEMARVFRDSARAAWRGAGLGGLVVLWVRTLTDTLVNATRERVHGSKEGVATLCCSLYTSTVCKSIGAMAVNIAFFVSWLRGIPAFTHWLPTIPIDIRGWAVIIAVIVVGFVYSLETRRSSWATLCKGMISWAGLMGWIFVLLTAEHLGLVDLWARPLVWVPIAFGGAEVIWQKSADGFAKLKTTTGWGLHLGIAIVALLLLLAAPAPYVASNAFLLFVAAVNGVDALLFPIALKTRKSDADTN